MTWLDWVVIIGVMGLVVLPPRWDPAVRLREWLERRGRDER